MISLYKDKIKKLCNLCGNITLVRTDVLALYASILHEDGLETLIEIEDYTYCQKLRH